MDALPLFDHARISGPPPGVPADIAALFERLALEVAATGRKRFSADAICHRIRWFEEIERRNASFHLNNNITSVLARWFLDRHPKLKAQRFFELRQSRGEQAA